MPNVTDTLTNSQLNSQVLVGERPDYVVNIATSPQVLVGERPDYVVNTDTDLQILLEGTGEIVKNTETGVQSILDSPTEILKNLSIRYDTLKENSEVVTNQSVNNQRLLSDLQSSSIYVTRNTWPSDGTTTTVTVVIADNNFIPVSGRTVKLHTKPAGAVGDNVTHVTDSTGKAVFNVSALIYEFITYSFSDVTP